MKRLVLPLLGAMLLLSACYKDDLDMSVLTTNPLDPEYSGPALIVLDSGVTVPYFDSGTQQMEAYVKQYIHIRTDLLPPNTLYRLYIKKLGTGDIFDYSLDFPQGDPIYYRVQLGSDYCYEYHLKVQYSLTKGYTYCTRAEL